MKCGVRPRLGSIQTRYPTRWQTNYLQKLQVMHLRKIRDFLKFGFSPRKDRPHRNLIPNMLRWSTMSAINSQIWTSHKTASWTQKEHNRSLKILWRTQSIQQGSRHPFLLYFRLCLKEGIGHRSSYVSWRERIHSNAMLSPLLSQGSCHLLYSRLAWVVGGAGEPLFN